MKKINTIIVSETQPPTTDVLWINDNKLSYFGKGTWKTIENNTESKDSKEQLDIREIYWIDYYDAVNSKNYYTTYFEKKQYLYLIF